MTRWSVSPLQAYVRVEKATASTSLTPTELPFKSRGEVSDGVSVNETP